MNTCLTYEALRCVAKIRFGNVTAVAAYPDLRKTGRPLRGTIAKISFALLSLVLAISSATVLAQEPIEIKPAANIDEREFLIYNYRNIRGDMPKAGYAGAANRQNLIALRSRGNRYLIHIKERKFDAKVESLYSDLLKVIDATDLYAAELDRIDRNILARANQASAETGFKAGFAGGTSAAIAQQQGASAGDAAFTALATALITYATEASQKRQELDEAKRQALESASRDFNRTISELQARETNAMGDLSQQYHWTRDADGIKVDRLTQLEGELAAKYSKAKTAEEAIAISKDLLAIASLVPAGAVYDEHREFAIFYAARAQTWAAEKELKDKGKNWGSVPSPTADYAIRLWDAAIQYGAADRNQFRRFGFEVEVPESARSTYDPRDPIGLKRSQRAWALAMAGRFDEAKREGNNVWEIRQNDLGFVYNYLRVWSVSGKFEGSEDILVQHLRRVLSGLGQFGITSELDCGVSHHLADIRRDRSLEALRRARREQCKDLFSVKHEWQITWGILNDDISIINKSAFAITNVVLETRMEAGGKTWTPVLKAPCVGPGEKYKWANAVSIPGGRLDNSTATLTCDQNR